MRGDPIQAVDEGVRAVYSALQDDNVASEIAWISVITFESSAHSEVPLAVMVRSMLFTFDIDGITKSFPLLQIPVRVSPVRTTS